MPCHATYGALLAPSTAQPLTRARIKGFHVRRSAKYRLVQPMLDVVIIPRLRNSAYRKDLLWVFAYLESGWVAIGKLIDREFEGAALAMLIAVDRTGNSVIALGREQFVAQRLAADIEIALVVRFADLFDGIGQDHGCVIGLSVE